MSRYTRHERIFEEGEIVRYNEKEYEVLEVNRYKYGTDLRIKPIDGDEADADWVDANDVR